MAFSETSNRTLLNDVGECVGNLTRRNHPTNDPMGCYNLNNNDTLNGLSNLNFPDPYKDRDENLMDPALCIIHCADYLFKYAALRRGKECRCGTETGLLGYIRYDDTFCNLSCIGNSSYKCGGENVYTIYEVGSGLSSHNKFIPNITVNDKLKVVKNLEKDSRYMGCIKDSPYCNQRSLNGTLKELPNMTVENCIRICREGNFEIIGLEIGSQCFCAHDFNSSTNLDKSDCSTSCEGNSSQICGGPLALSIYNASEDKITSGTKDNNLSIGAIIGIIL
ncbi:15562_t:CDS:1, partial [Gigaspora margarita]